MQDVTAPAVLARVPMVLPSRVAHGTHTTSPVMSSKACAYAGPQMQAFVELS